MKNQKNQNKCINPTIFARSPFWSCKFVFCFLVSTNTFFKCGPCRMRAKVCMIPRLSKKCGKSFGKKATVLSAIPTKNCSSWHIGNIQKVTLDKISHKSYSIRERRQSLADGSDGHKCLVIIIPKKIKFCIYSEKVKNLFQIVKLRTSLLSQSTINVPKS